MHIEDEAELSSYLNSELGLEDDRVANPTKGGFAETLVVTLFLFTFTVPGSDDLDLLPLEESKQVLECGVFSAISLLASSISLFSHGFAAIQRSSQLHPQLHLSSS